MQDGDEIALALAHRCSWACFDGGHRNPRPDDYDRAFYMRTEVAGAVRYERLTPRGDWMPIAAHQVPADVRFECGRPMRWDLQTEESRV